MRQPVGDQQQPGDQQQRRPASSPRIYLAFMITAIYPDARRKVLTIKKTAQVCPIFGDDFSPGDEFSAPMAAKSPSGENST